MEKTNPKAKDEPKFDGEDIHISVDGEMSQNGTSVIYTDIDSETSEILLDFITDIENGEYIYHPQIKLKTDISTVSVTIGEGGLVDLRDFLNSVIEYMDDIPTIRGLEEKDA